jgi:hypothetical protein
MIDFTKLTPEQIDIACESSEEDLSNLCSDFDHDCLDMHELAIKACSEGGECVTTCTGEEIYLAPPDGVCPMVG